MVQNKNRRVVVNPVQDGGGSVYIFRATVLEYSQSDVCILYVYSFLCFINKYNVTYDNVATIYLNEKYMITSSCHT